jgi:hypothetical protein
MDKIKKILNLESKNINNGIENLSLNMMPDSGYAIPGSVKKNVLLLIHKLSEV